jgi:hypothetical protein
MKMNEDLTEYYEERAAILEYCAGLPRSEVETYREHRAKVDSEKIAK